METARTGLLFWVSIDKNTNITGVEFKLLGGGFKYFRSLNPWGDDLI